MQGACCAACSSIATSAAEYVFERFPQLQGVQEYLLLSEAGQPADAADSAPAAAQRDLHSTHRQAGASQAGGACMSKEHAGVSLAPGSCTQAGPSDWADMQATPGLTQAPAGHADAGQTGGAHARGPIAAGMPETQEAEALAEGGTPARVDPEAPARGHPAAALGPLALLDRAVLTQLAAVMQLVGEAARADGVAARRQGRVHHVGASFSCCVIFEPGTSLSLGCCSN